MFPDCGVWRQRVRFTGHNYVGGQFQDSPPVADRHTICPLLRVDDACSLSASTAFSTTVLTALSRPSSVRLRTDAARRYKKVANAEALIWKILMIAEKKFRRLNSPELLEQVYKGQLFEDGIDVEEITRKRSAA